MKVQNTIVNESAYLQKEFPDTCQEQKTLEILTRS